MHLDRVRRDTCSPDVQIMCDKAKSATLLIIVRGCTSDLLKLEVATKAIMYFARKASPSNCKLLADLCLLYSPLTWKVGGRTNLDKFYLEQALESPIVQLHDVLDWKVEQIPSLNMLLRDSTGKHPTILQLLTLVTQQMLHTLGYQILQGNDAQALLKHALYLPSTWLQVIVKILNDSEAYEEPKHRQAQLN